MSRREAFDHDEARWAGLAALALATVCTVLINLVAGWWLPAQFADLALQRVDSMHHRLHVGLLRLRWRGHAVAWPPDT